MMRSDFFRGGRLATVAKGLLACVLAAVGFAVGPLAYADSYPARPVKLISPYGAGGSNDTSARVLADALSHKYGQQFVVENRPGAGTRVANELVAHAAPDGYTLLWAAAPFAINTAAGLKQRYDIAKDFKPVGPRVVGPVFLIVNAASPARTLADFVKLAREKKDGITFASPGIGSGPHLTGELFAAQAGFKALTVHYKGDATAYTELLAGPVDSPIAANMAGLPIVQGGNAGRLAGGEGEGQPGFAAGAALGEKGQ